MQRFEILPHTADTAVAIYGESFDDLFANAGSALFELMFDIPPGSRGARVSVSAEADGIEELLVAWLSELLVRSEVEGMVFSDLEVEVMDNRVAASGRAVPVDQLELIGTPIKAVTYHDLEIRRVGTRWVARVVFDV
ncbi:MAG: archease [Acidimicrobiia bacterium]|nr:archease [Acidimicrobiia bacterium]